MDQIVTDLKSKGYRADSLHGDMTQSRRDDAMLKFRRQQSRILVATDVAARGLDVSGVEAVINYDVPPEEEYYVHRIGRTARMGKSGRAFTLVLSGELGRAQGDTGLCEHENKAPGHNVSQGDEGNVET